MLFLSDVIFNIHSLKCSFSDFSDGRVYWTEYGKMQINSAFLNGSDERLLDIAASTPMGITTTNTKVYFSTWSNGQLFVFSKSNTSTKSELIYSSGGHLMSIKVFQSTRKL